MTDNLKFALENLIDIAESEGKKTICNIHEDETITLLITNKDNYEAWNINR